ncbi:MAG: hypothetical protein HC904_03755 [Blastochloris sp.]|nr:hypothetical protein [Blastochloris sp.]
MKLNLDRILENKSPAYVPWSGVPLLVYGAGHCGRETAGILLRQGFEVLGFIDERADTLGRVEDKPCWRPDCDDLFQKAQAGVGVVVAVFNYTVDAGAIVEKLWAYGFTRVISYLEFLECFQVNESNKYWFAPRDFFGNTKRICGRLMKSGRMSAVGNFIWRP